MTTTQVYDIVNSIYAQMNHGEALDTVDPRGLVAFGDTVLTSSTSTEEFLNTLVQRIGRTIISYRAYSNSLKGLVKDNFEWGAIVQKVKVAMPVAVADDSYGLTDGQSVDPYIVKKPVVNQKLFVTRAPYSFYITIQEEHLKEAFTSADAMGSFISAIFGEVQNKLEVTLENLGRVCIGSFIVNMKASQKIHLLTDYNTNSGISTPLTATTAMFDEGFLRYAIGQMKTYAKRMKGMSNLYNAESVDRFTPEDKQMFAVLSDFQNALETQVQYAAFNDGYVKKEANIDIPYWQSADERASVKMNNKSGTETTVENIVALIFDKDAMGTFREENKVASTPVNARGLYYNTFWHERQMWFNDLSENAILFCLD